MKNRKAFPDGTYVILDKIDDPLPVHPVEILTFYKPVYDDRGKVVTQKKKDKSGAVIEELVLKEPYTVEVPFYIIPPGGINLIEILSCGHKNNLALWNSDRSGPLRVRGQCPKGCAI